MLKIYRVIQIKLNQLVCEYNTKQFVYLRGKEWPSHKRKLFFCLMVYTYISGEVK